MSTQRMFVAQFALAWLIALIAMGVLDGLWLGWLARGFYKREIGDLMADSVRIAPALLFYLCYPLAIVFFGVEPADSLLEATLRSAGIGLLAYATYDLSNLSTLRGWSTSLSMVDTTWGTLASAAAGAAAYAATLGRAS